MGKLVGLKLWSVLNYFITLATGYCYLDLVGSLNVYSPFSLNDLSIGTSLVVCVSLFYWVARIIIMISNYRTDKIERKQAQIKREIEHEAVLRKTEEERQMSIDAFDLNEEMNKMKKRNGSH